MVNSRILSALFLCTNMVFISYSAAELQPLDETSLSESSAQAGITLDIDLSGVGFSYNYKNNENPNEEFWISGVDAGGDVVQISGITIDVAPVAGISGGAIAIGLPTEIKLSNVKTGDYYIARDNTTNATSPPKASDVKSNINRKLFGLSWNTNANINFSPSTNANLVEAHSFENAPFQAAGRVLVFAD